ncbi:long-chain fatty acid transport protein [Paraburkholderia sp. UCT70]|uniref:OmpP1/FadL family transporter n=1 Tax=Paraburkholderia sp. UCT70 TaxID=2991068 RepID=UPI003D1B0E02
MNHRALRGIKLALSMCGMGALSSTAFATNGSYLTANGPFASGMGGVSIALPQDTTAAANNPAGMAELGARFDGYGLLLVTQADATFGSTANKFYSRGIVPAPGGGVNFQIAPQWTFGVSVTGAGLASNYGQPLLPIPGAGPAKASLTVVNTAPTVTYKPLPNLAIGLSLVLGIEQFRANGVIGAGPDGIPFALPTHGNSWAAGIGSGVGVLWTPVPAVTVGASYYTKTWFSALSGYKNDLFAPSNGHVDSPAHYGAGIAVRPLPRLTVGMDYMRIEWSKAAGYNIASSFNWHDQNVFRFGASYDFSDRWTIRAGYSMANSHLDSDHTLANFFANGINDKAVTLGVTYAIDKRNLVTASLEYDIPRTIVGTGPSTGTNISTNLQLYTIGYTHKF